MLGDTPSGKILAKEVLAKLFYIHNKPPSTMTLIGIVDCSSSENLNRRHLARLIREHIPSDVDYEAFHFEDDLDLSRYDALIISGSMLSVSEFQGMMNRGNITPEYRGYENLTSAMSRYDGPAFGICAGSHFLAFAGGGSVARLDKLRAGYEQHELMPKAEGDPVFDHLPNPFYGALFHTDIVEALPQGASIVQCDVLAARENYIQAWRAKLTSGALRYGIQAHPEICVKGRETILIRVNHRWVTDQIGEDGYLASLDVPDGADYSLAKTIPNFCWSI